MTTTPDLSTPLRLPARSYVLSVTLEGGETHSFEVAKMPRHWKSWVMQQMPYGTDFFGCCFARKVVA